jgi:hypothetical protein
MFSYAQGVIPVGCRMAAATLKCIHIAAALKGADTNAKRDRADAKQRAEQRQRFVLSKLDRGYDHYVSGRISKEFWTRKSERWEEERRLAEASWPVLNRPTGGFRSAARRF